MDNTQKAISWWKTLNPEEKDVLQKKHNLNGNFNILTAIEVEEMWYKEVLETV